MALRADPEDQEAGFAEQLAVQTYLMEHHDWQWVETRSILEKDVSGGELNFQEKKRGDLQNERMGTSMEVQCSPDSDNCYWSKSKFIHSKAEWQCFVYQKTGTRLVISTELLKKQLGPIDKLDWRDARDPYILLWYQFLRNIGAVDLYQWCKDSK